MVPDIHADPEKLRQFARTLTKSSQQFDQLSRQMKQGLDATGWQDSERVKFESDFAATLKTIRMFSERLKSEYVPKLQRKAAALDNFRR